MKIVLQRVNKASVAIDGETVGRIGRGYLLLVGFDRGDHNDLLQPMLDKILHLKLFSDGQGRFSDSLMEIDGELLIVSQFTLSAELKKGKKPSFSKAMAPEMAEALYQRFIHLANQSGIRVDSGRFGALMQVELENEGPVTILLDSRQVFPSLHASTDP